LSMDLHNSARMHTVQYHFSWTSLVSSRNGCLLICDRFNRSAWISDFLSNLTDFHVILALLTFSIVY
jgi:hypothetical protein